MSQRVSGYARLPDEKYFTPEWVTEALLPHLGLEGPAHLHEPAAGAGHIVRVLKAAGHTVTTGDRSLGSDFMHMTKCPAVGIITNPPYNAAEEFIVHAIELMKPDGFVAVLLRSDYDHAATRRYMFEPPFAKRVVLTKRIRWIENSTGSPSFNHAWFIWDWLHQGPPTIGYAP